MRVGRSRRWLVAGGLAAQVALGGVAAASAQGPEAVPSVTVLASSTPDGRAGMGSSNYPSVSADGRFVAFLSYSPDLVEGDTNGFADVFVRDLELGTTVRASVASDGTQGDGGVGPPAISADGRYVVFPSEASNLVPGDVNTCAFFPEPGTCPDIFVHDLVTGETRLASVRRGGTQANGESLYVTVSSDGRLVAFASLATNLTARDDNRKMDVFVKDMVSGKVRRVSDAPGAGGADSFSFAPAISADGSRVAFTSNASNLAGRDRNGVDDVFVRDLATWELVRVSVRPDGTESPAPSFGASLSSTGRFVAFGSEGDLKDRNGLPDGYVYDMATGRLRRFTRAAGGGEPDGGLEVPPSISADGRLVAFQSSASNLVRRDANGTSDVFVRNMDAGRTRLVSVALAGGAGNSASAFPASSANGCWVGFGSYATDLSDLGGGGGAESAQVFVRGSLCHRTDGDGARSARDDPGRRR